MTKFVTTLAQIRDKSPCKSGWKKLLTGLPARLPADWHDEAKLDLKTIAEINGVPDAIWCLRTVRDLDLKATANLAIGIAYLVLPIFENKFPTDLRVRNSLEASTKFVAGEISFEEFKVAKDAVGVANAAARSNARSNDNADDKAAYAAYGAAYAAYGAAKAAYGAAAADADTVYTVYTIYTAAANAVGMAVGVANAAAFKCEVLKLLS